MIYKRLVTDYETGEVHRISVGDHLPFTEFAKKLQIKRSILTKAMLEAGICQKEYDETAKKNRNRLHPEAEAKGLGIRIVGSRGPFDVLTPIGQEVTEEALKAYLCSISPKQWSPAFDALNEYDEERRDAGYDAMTAQMRLCWLVDHFKDIPLDVIVKGLGVSERLVYRHKGIRDTRLEKLSRGLRYPRPSLSKLIEKNSQYLNREATMQGLVTPF